MLTKRRERFIFSVFIIFTLTSILYITKEIYIRIDEINYYIMDNLSHQNELLRRMAKDRPLNLPKPKQELKLKV